MPMPPKPDTVSGLIFLPTVLPKGGSTQEPTKGVVDFKLSQKQPEATKKELKISPFINGQPHRIMDDLYNGLNVRDAPDKERKINLIYDDNNSLIREPATVLGDGKADCDEVTRTAYLLAWESGVKNIAMVEISWIEKTAEGERRTGHSFIVLMPQSNNENEQPRIYDLTYYKKGKPLQVGSDGLEAAIKREYASDAANHGFGITMRGNLNEVEAAHYEWVGKYFVKPHTQDWKKAGESFSRAVKLVPTRFEYNWGLAVAYENQKRWKEAAGFYKICYDLQEVKTDPLVLGALGSAYANAGLKREGEKFLKQALENATEPALKLKIMNNLKVIDSR